MFIGVIDARFLDKLDYKRDPEYLEGVYGYYFGGYNKFLIANGERKISHLNI